MVSPSSWGKLRSVEVTRLNSPPLPFWNVGVSKVSVPSSPPKLANTRDAVYHSGQPAVMTANRILRLFMFAFPICCC